METCQNLNLEEAKKLKVRDLLKDFLEKVDENLKYFCKLIRKELREERDEVISITGYPGVGKSQTATIISCLIDHEYTFGSNICFIPTTKEVEIKYLSLPMYSVLHIDEASRSIHKHKWYDKMQQKLNELYDTEREGHYLCTILLMPRFQNFSENFRNFRIKYWINLIERGIGIVYKRDEDKDTRDPWHLDENYKLKQKKWYGKKTFERDIPSIIKMEQQTKNYWFYFTLPEIPKEVWSIYKGLKKESRNTSVEKDIEEVGETYKEKMDKKKRERQKKILELQPKNYNISELAVYFEVSEETIKRDLREIAARQKLERDSTHTLNNENSINNKYKQDDNVNLPEKTEDVYKI